MRFGLLSQSSASDLDGVRLHRAARYVELRPVRPHDGQPPQPLQPVYKMQI